MIESDRSETEEADMDRLQLSSDSIDALSPKKRPRAEDSEDETDSLAKKRQCLLNEQPKMLENDNSKTIGDKNNTDGSDVEEDKYRLCTENEQETSLPESDKKNKEKQRDGSKQENEMKSAPYENNVDLNKSPGEINIKEEMIENVDNSAQKPITNASVASIPKNQKTGMGEAKREIDNTIDREENSEEDEMKKRHTTKKCTVDSEVVDNPVQKPVTNASEASIPENQKAGMGEIKEEIDNTIDREENSKKDEMEKRHTAKKRTVDTEVVDGLELSVECASDKEESSSESEDEKDVKPRPKTIIVKAEPNESELDCSSEGEEKSDSQQITDTLEIKSEKSRAKRRGSRTSFSKLKASGSEDSQNSNSDEDYSPRTKKKMKKSPTMKKSTSKYRSVESKRGRGRGVRRNLHKKNAEYISADEDACTNVAERVNKTKTKNGIEEELSEKESLSKSESDSNSEKEARSIKGRRGRHSNAKSDKHIQMLKKYLKIAGVKVKCYNDIWADCKSNAAKIKRLKELLERNGISGRPTLEKCRRAREENERMREVSELDVSNIISEGRVTRARRNMENVKKTTLSGTPPRHRESRNTFRRIQTVVDSDSE